MNVAEQLTIEQIERRLDVLLMAETIIRMEVNKATTAEGRFRRGLGEIAFNEVRDARNEFRAGRETALRRGAAVEISGRSVAVARHFWRVGPAQLKSLVESYAVTEPLD